jgi:hypothetical protein
MSSQQSSQSNSKIGNPKVVPLGHNGAETCAALVEEVFQKQPPGPKPNEVVEAALLPRLLSRATSAMWSQEPTKNIGSEVQVLRAKKVAAAKLLDAIEQEAEQIEHRLQEKCQQAKLNKHTKNMGFLGLPWAGCTNCGPVNDSEEISVQFNHSTTKNLLELRPVLRNRLRECEETLAKRDSELRQLQHELSCLRAEREAMCRDEKDALLDQSINTKEALLRRYAATFNLDDAAHLQSVFFSWRQYAHQRLLRSKMMKRACFALTSDESQCKAIAFSNWRSLARDKRQAQRFKQEDRRQAVARSYAARFLVQADSARLRAIIVEWWRCSKESLLQARVAAVQAEMQAVQQSAVLESRAATPLVSRPGQVDAGTKACCTLM